MPTLQDVATRAGVSTATVSKVLSNTPYFTEETRQKVMRAVEELGYIPNLAARALSSGKTHIVAVVFPFVYDAIFDDPHVLQIVGGIESECRQNGYNLLLSTPRVTSDGGLDEHYRQLIMSGYIEGVVALDNVPFASVSTLVQERGIPLINIGYPQAGPHLASDDARGCYEAMEHIIGLGHRAIGIIGVPENLHKGVQYRVQGLRDGAQAGGLDFDSLPRIDGDFTMSSGITCAVQLLEQHPELTALICLNDRMAMGAVQHARQIGRSIPHDLSIVGYDDIPLAAAFDPPLTSVDQLAAEKGRLAMRMLVELLDGKVPESVTLPTRLVIRQSTAAPNGR